MKCANARLPQILQRSVERIRDPAGQIPCFLKMRQSVIEACVIDKPILSSDFRIPRYFECDLLLRRLEPCRQSWKCAARNKKRNFDGVKNLVKDSFWDYSSHKLCNAK